MELAGKHVVVTGAASGIGRACAARFVAEGARVVASDRDAERLGAVAAEIGATAVPADVSREQEIRDLIAEAQRGGGPIDLFFSNAGVPGPGGGPEAPDDELQLTWEVNVMAHVWAARALLPDWVARGDGYLLSTASAAGLLTQVSAMAYSITKHAAVALAEWLSITYGDDGIKVSCLCPQGVRTPMLDVALEDPVGAAPLLAGGLLEPEDVAAVVVAGIRDEAFLILPHEVVAQHLALKGAQPERWLNGMRRLVRQARTQTPPA
ncbi:MAG TPA: SDR family oxidoreductase [Solirubrobacteraceae bacterium]|jgi:NAD(P)-dependent dehydrogenase (short-subunit alcohol dehydrogenase family)|nr:SDR family oxidoreductase [Solirubrobacteraceae bacterium]